MQIRLTVTLGPRASAPGAAGAAGAPSGGAACDVLVTAPAGTPLSAVTGGLVSTAAAAVGGSASGGAVPGQGGGSEPTADSAAAVYAGTERLDPHRQILGEPPLLDGAVISLHGPAAMPALAAYGSARARLHVISGPDAGGIHLLQGGKVSLGRSAEADVPLDDPDVSRLHCAVTVSDGGAVTVADLGSTNGTTLDGAPVGGQPVLFRPGSTLRVGESALRVETSPPGGPPDFAVADGRRAATPLPVSLPTQPDGNGQLRLTASGTGPAGPRGDRDGAAAVRAREDAAESPADGSAGTAHGYAPGGPLPDGSTTHGSGIAQHARYAQQFTPGASGAEPGRPRPRGLGAWARRFAGGQQGEEREAPFVGTQGPAAGLGPTTPPGGEGSAQAPSEDERRPDPATILLTALGPGPRLWEREPGHPEALTVRIGTAQRGDGRPGAPVTVGLREAGALGLAGPRPRLMGLARSVLAQLAALHGPSSLEMVLISADRSRDAEDRIREWSWLGWLPHLRPAHGQNCRLLTAYDRDQAAARAAELTHRLDESRQQSEHAEGRFGSGPYTVLIVDGDPGSASLRDAVARLAAEGPRAGIHLLCLAETPAATPSSPVSETVRAAYATSAAFRECGALALLSGAVATAVRVVRRDSSAPGAAEAPGATAAGTPGTVCTLDAVSAAWAERFARAVAPLRESEGTSDRTGSAARSVVTLPRSSRLLDELGLARATPAALLARWAEPGGSNAAGGNTVPPGGRAALVFGAGPRGSLEAELGLTHGHALVTGRPGSGKTELLCSLAASLAVGSPPDRLRLVLLDGDGESDGLHTCLELPHARHHLSANDVGLMREFAQSISGELKRRAELFGPEGTYEGFARQVARSGHRLAAQQRRRAQPAGAADPGHVSDPRDEPGTLRLRTQTGPAPGGGTEEPADATTSNAGAIVQHLDAQSVSLPRIVILVDDFDTLVDPSLGNPGRPAAGSVMRALEGVAKDGARLGMHLVAASGRPDRTAATAVAQAAALHAELTWKGGGEGAGGEDAVPGRGLLIEAGGTATAFQAGRITGRIPRTATQRPTVVPLDWTRAGDPPTRRPVRELGNGPTDLALLASAVGRAAQSLGVDRQESGTPAANTSRSGQDEVLES